MNKQEAITQKVNELGEAVRASKGSVMVIGIAPTENENESVIIASLQGRGRAVAEAVGKVMVSKTGEGLRTVIQEGVMLSCIMTASGVKADKEEVVEKEFNE